MAGRSNVRTIFRKELLDTLRDRKTLMFMLLIPSLAMPLMILGITRLIQKQTREQAVEVVRIAATEETRAAYAGLVHRWFLASPMANALGAARSPFVQALIRPEEREALAAIPGEIFEDPAAFEGWVRDLAEQARAGVEDSSLTREQEDGTAALDEDAAGFALDLYRVAFKGLGLVEWVDPETLATPDETESLSAALEELSEESRELPHAAAASAAIQAKELHAYLHLPAGTGSLVEEEQQSLEVLLVHDSTVRLSKEARDRLRFVTEEVGEALVRLRLAERELGRDFLEPLVNARGTDTASSSARAFDALGAFLPYILIMFAFLGGMYPAIDLGAGEKERGTLETLVLSPASRVELALGKFLVILTTALTAAFLGVISMALTLRYLAPPEVMEKLDIQLPLSTILPVAALAIPPAAAFAGIFLAISIYARSFKEAQNYIAPLQFVLILPAMAPMLPGMEMNWKVAAIPLVNVSMLAKDFLKGDQNWGYYALTFGSCLAAAGLCLAFAVYQFRREEVLFRS